MRIVTVKNLTSDMELAKPIFYKDSILLNTGCKDLIKYKQRLIDLGIYYVYVNDQLSEDIEINDLIKDETRRKSEVLIKNVFKDIKFNKKIMIKEIKTEIKNIINEIMNNEDIVVNLIDMRSFDSYTFSHSVNVAVLSILLAKSLNYNTDRLLKLGVGAILHDTGKVFIPENILNKKNKLSNKEYKIIQEHPRLGYNQIKDNYLISPTSQIIILTHHERLNGTGYPKGLIDTKIHEYSKIVAITDVFDALNSDRVYRKRLPVPEIIDYLMVNCHTQFEYSFVDKFIKNIAVYPNGSIVTLSNGQKALVKQQNKNYPTRPILKLIQDKNGEKIDDTIDLLKELDIVIKDVEF